MVGLPQVMSAAASCQLAGTTGTPGPCAALVARASSAHPALLPLSSVGRWPRDDTATRLRLGSRRCPCLMMLRGRAYRTFAVPEAREKGAARVYAQAGVSGLEEGPAAGAASQDGALEDRPVQVQTRTWRWGDYDIRYQFAGATGPALLLVHGFGANCDHWRKNIPVLAKSHRVFAIDLLGYGYSDKPNPRLLPPNTLYTFDTWGKQILQFCSEVVNDRPFIICNSVGGIAGLQAALREPDAVRGLLLLNISLRMLHIKKQPWYARPFVRALQNFLRNTNFGERFFKSVAKPDAVKRILCECYHDDTAVTDELVQLILGPGLQPGAVDVFLDFICYSGGPLPEEMLPLVQCPVWIGWGEKDPWEPIALGKAFEKFDTVEEFVVLLNTGHCPQDEAPHLVNPLVERFVARYASLELPHR